MRQIFSLGRNMLIDILVINMRADIFVSNMSADILCRTAMYLYLEAKIFDLAPLICSVEKHICLDICLKIYEHSLALKYLY